MTVSSKPPRTLPGLLLRMLLLTGLAVGVEASAHEGTPEDTRDGSPATRGLRLEAAVGLAAVDARDALPGAMPPGVIGTGTDPDDLKRHPLEHAALGLRARADASWSGALGWGWHGSDRAHVEDAWAQWQPAAGAGRWLRVGRQAVGRGAVIGSAGHLDRFLLAPYAVRAAFDGDWIEDGAQARWTPDADDPSRPAVPTVEAGLWRASRFPASSAEPRLGVHLHPQWQIEDVQVDVFVARLQARQRGTQRVAANSAHSHGTPDCTSGLAQRACFDGRVWLGGVSARWAPDEQSWEVQGAWLVRDERGTLATANGQADTHSRYQGGWIDAFWRPGATTWLGLRLQDFAPSHHLEGPGASLVATDTGLDRSGRSRGLAATGGWQVHPQWRLAMEVGRLRPAQQAALPYVAARLLWQARTP